MNTHDSDRMAEVLRKYGWAPAQSIDQADMIVYNTCSVREKAEHKLRSELGKVSSLKKNRPELVLVVAGCVAEQEGKKLLAKNPHLDLVIGPDHILDLPVLALEQRQGALARVKTGFDVDFPQFLSATPVYGEAPVSVYVTTMKGCDERCSFCVVPFTRGPERYRSAVDIVSEIQNWVNAGAREITLLGQTVDSFRDLSLPSPKSSDPDESQFPLLLRLIADKVPNLFRLRYTSPHPKHLTKSLIAAHEELDVLTKHVHMPVQSGSNRILKRMIRRYSREEYLQKVSALKQAKPGLTLSTDIIVGFPGETDDDFEETLSLVREAEFTSLFGFKYSPRPFTPALKLKDDVNEETKAERLARLFVLAEEQQQKHLESLVESVQCVLIERAKTQDGVTTFQGRTDRNEIVHVVEPDRNLLGQDVFVHITHAFKHSLGGVLSEEHKKNQADKTPFPKGLNDNPKSRSLKVIRDRF